MAKSKKMNSRAAINRIKVESLPYFSLAGSNDIIPYGIDNEYPNRVNETIRKSPTSLGCVKRQSEFIFGNGVKDGFGEIVVNRDGETLNDVIWQSIRFGYSTIYGFALHFNFNILGQITEIFSVNPEYVRKHKSLDKVDFGLWSNRGGFLIGIEEFITVDLYGKHDPIKRIEHEGIEYHGQVYYYSKDGEIYPTSPLDSALISASYEKEAQIYPYANIKNGFSGTTVIKLATQSTGTKAAEEVDKMQDDIKELHGAENTGSTLVIQIPVDSEGVPKDYKVVENLTPTNVDKLFPTQNEKAENDILKVYNMPQILLGVSSKGMFNQASFADAFNYKNGDVEIDRKAIEREFNKFLPKTVFGIDKIELDPFPMKEKEQEQTQRF